MTITTPINNAIQLFDGYVESVSLNMGYGANGSNCQIGLAYENDGPGRTANIRASKSSPTLNPFEAKFPSLGTAVGIKIGNCSYVGLLQRYVNKRSISGYRWDLVLESPASLLEGIYIILEGFQGTSYTGQYPTSPELSEKFQTQINNVWNPFALMENLEYGGIFGGALVNSSGHPGVTVRNNTGNIIHKGALRLIEEISRGEHPEVGGKAVFADSTFEIDLSEVINVIEKLDNSHLFRINSSGVAIPLSTIIQEACDLVMYDYVVVLEPKSGPIINGVISDAVIKIKMIDKSVPPNPDRVRELVDEYEKAGTLIDASVGKELSKNTTQKLVIGGPATRYYYSLITQNIQVWGKTKAQKPIYTNQIILDDGTLYPVDLLEVRCAMSGIDTWLLYHLIKKYKGQLNSRLSGLVSGLFSNVRIDNYTINKIAAGTITVNDIMDSTKNSMTARAQLYTGVDVQAALSKIHQSVKSAGDTFYGKEFLVPLPMEVGGFANNLKWIQEDQIYQASWEIADSAYAETFPFNDVSFYDSSGKMKATAVWAYDGFNADYSDLGNSYCRGNPSAFPLVGGGIGATISVDQDIYWLSIPGYGYRAYAHVTCPAVNVNDILTTPQNGLYKLLNRELGMPLARLKQLASFGAENGPTAYGIAPDRAPPVHIGIPQQSTRYTWGPWWRWSSKRGKTEVIVDSSLTPETYGGFNNLNAVGFTQAAVINSEMSGVESGHIELAGLPIGGIAERFANSGPYVTNIDIAMDIGGIKTTYKFNSWTPQFGRLGKYNIDRLAKITTSSIAAANTAAGFESRPPLPSNEFKDAPFVNKNNRPNAMNMGSMGGIFGGLANNLLNIGGGNPVNALGPASQDYANSYGNSNEQMVSPIEISSSPPTSQTKPQFLKPVNSSGGKFDGAHHGPTSKELNPYFAHGANDFQIAIMGDSPPDSLNVQEHNPNKVRVFGHRGPMIMSGWGFDLNDMPVPARGTSGNDRFFFADDAGTKRELWKSGPLDVKWDDERKVWAGGPHIVEGILASKITAPDSPDSPTTFVVSLRRGKGSGWDDVDETITVTNRDPSLETEESENIFVIAIRLNYEWRPLWVGCEAGSEE